MVGKTLLQGSPTIPALCPILHSGDSQTFPCAGGHEIQGSPPLHIVNLLQGGGLHPPNPDHNEEAPPWGEESRHSNLQSVLETRLTSSILVFIILPVAVGK